MTSAKGALILSALLAAAAARPVRAIVSSGQNYRNARSALGAAGLRTSGGAYTNDSTMGEIAVTSKTGTAYMGRSGLMPTYQFPGRIGDLSASGCIIGQTVLTWTAPGNDGFAPGTHARDYVIKVSTDPNQSPSASVTLFYSASNANPINPITPAVEGSSESIVIGGLASNTTYYFAVVAQEADGTPSTLSQGATNQAGSGAALQPFILTSGFRDSLLNWPAPPTLAAQAFCRPAAYNVVRSTLPTSNFSAIVSTLTSSYVDADVQAGTTYFYYLSAVNAQSVELGRTPTQAVYVRTKPSLPPAFTSFAMSGTTTTVTWGAPTQFDFGLRFANPALPRTDELSGYRIYRSTSLYNPIWSELAQVSSGTFQYVDPNSQAGYFYRVTAINVTEESLAPLERSSPYGDAYVLALDNQSFMRIPNAQVASLFPPGEDPYRFVTTQVSPTDPKVLADARFDILRGTVPVNFQFPKQVEVHMTYAVPGVSPQAAPDQTSVYWNTGARWVKLYGTMEPLTHSMVAQVDRAGEYQLRALERTQDFFFNKAGLSSRFMTPNGDGLNDYIFFKFDNPRDSDVTGKIFDRTGALVTSLSCTTSAPCTTMVWDGKANGQLVPGGVYIYQLEAEGKVFNGTVVVIR